MVGREDHTSAALQQIFHPRGFNLTLLRKPDGILQ